VTPPPILPLEAPARLAASAAVAPLERPRPLPGWARPLARAITGRTDTRMTSGAATRRALRSAGTHGAASGGIVHLPNSPERTPRGMNVLAHELSHVADQQPRPRLFGEGLLDMGERRAREVGQAVGSAAGGARQTATRTAGRAARAAQGALGTGERLLERPPISSLPTGGLAAAVPAAVRAAEGVVSDARGAASSGMETASGFLDQGQAVAGQAIDDATAAAQQGFAGAERFARGAVGAAQEQAGALRRRAEDAVGDARDAFGSAGQQAAAALEQAGHVDAMIEAIEQRLLAEMERRGGRFQGLF
jgi:hypothetical protein